MVKVNEKTLQNPNSKTCGLYAAHFIIKMCRGESLDSALASFRTNDFVYNDKIIVTLFQKRLLALGIDPDSLV